MHVTAVEFQRNFGTYQDLAQQEPVEITRYGKQVLVLMSAQEYAALQMVKKKRL